MVNQRDLKKIDSQKLQKIIEKNIKKRKLVEDGQEIHDIKSKFSTKDNKDYALIFTFGSGSKKSYISKKKHFGILVCYNSSSGEINEVIINKEEIGSFKPSDKKREAEKTIIKKAVEIELEEKSKAIIKLYEERSKGDIKDILIIGRTGDGKSALANVLVNEKFFKEGEYSASETNEIQSRRFECGFKFEKEDEKKFYRVIDTPGISHTKLSKDEVLSRIIKEVARSIMCSNLNQVFFVTSGRLTEEELEAYNVLETIIFKNDISGLTTIVRTNFPNFMDANKRNEDIQRINNKEYNNSSRSLEYNKIIHVDNPPLDVSEVTININVADPESIKKTEVEEMAKEKTDLNKKVRDISREVLLKRLYECRDKRYEVCGELELLSRKIIDHVAKILTLDQGVNIEVSWQNDSLVKEVCSKEMEELVSSIDKKIKCYIEGRDSKKSLLERIGSLDKNQIIEKIREIDTKQVAATTAKGLDTAAKLATLGGPTGLAVSLVLGIISGSIKL